MVHTKYTRFKLFCCPECTLYEVKCLIKTIGLLLVHRSAACSENSMPCGFVREPWLPEVASRLWFILYLGDWWWEIRPQLLFQFIPKVSDGAEIRTLHRPAPDQAAKTCKYLKLETCLQKMLHLESDTWQKSPWSNNGLTSLWGKDTVTLSATRQNSKQGKVVIKYFIISM